MPPRARRTSDSTRGTRWCFTINNPPLTTEMRLTRLGSDPPEGSLPNDIKFLIASNEIGESGTPHIQGFVKFATRKTLNAVKGIIDPRGHYEVARGTDQQAADYCAKEGSEVFVRYGELSPTRQGRRTDLERLGDWIETLSEFPSQRDIIREFPGLWLRSGSRLFDVVSALRPEVEIQPGNPRPGWQRNLFNRLDTGHVNDRDVSFYIGYEGNEGKSWFTRWLLTKWPDKVQLLRIGRRDDLAHMIDETKSIFLFDIARGQMQFLQYSVLEMLKDRTVSSPKYNSRMKFLSQTPHVIVFGNEDPDMNAMSHDRYDLHVIRSY